ncbi:hypothetical protein [Pseudoalteromonas lipolytica]|uniref:hypothetical protein n=1 Tax=Pseudoalteromonas lipolytica TaxID=570156 RepID=UPI000825FC75|nr:hypothetical protein [Pseudoalteromonas lipolytica]
MQHNAITRSNRIPLRFKQYSEALSNQLNNLFNRARNVNLRDSPADPTIIKLNRIRRATQSLEHALPIALDYMSKISKEKFIQNGFESFLERDVWQELEYYCFQANASADISKWACRVEEGLENLVRAHFRDPNISAPFRVAYKGISIDITKAYELPIELLFDIKTLMNNYLKVLVDSNVYLKESTLRSYILGATTDLVSLLQSEEYKKSPHKNDPLTSVLSNKKFIDPFVNSKYFLIYLKHFNPNVWGTTRSQELKDKKLVHQYAMSISPIFEGELESYVTNLLTHHPKYQYDGRVSQLSSRAYSFVRLLHYLGDDAHDVIKLIQAEGIKGLATNDYEGFKLLKNLINELPKDAPKKFTQSLYVAIEIYNNSTNDELSLCDIIPFALAYYNENNDSIDIQHLKWLYENLPAYFNNVADFHKVSLQRKDGLSLQPITIRSYVDSMSRAMQTCSPHLSCADINTLAKQGVTALIENNYAILKNVREIIQSLTKQNSISLTTGKKYQNSIDKLLEFNGLHSIPSYKVNTDLRDKHAQHIQSKASSLYSYEEVVELAFHIEQNLNVPTYSLEEKLTLHAAKIILKSGWNLTPTLELEANDIFYIDTPIHTSKTPAIRLFKRRAHYATKWDRFNIDSTDFDNEGVIAGRDVSPVFFDVLTVKRLTTVYQKSNEKLLERIFTYETVNNTGRKKIETLTMQTFSTNIARLLLKSGCSVPFSAQKIRKKGLNFIYKKVSREFKRYQKAGKHSYAAFLKYYLKHDNLEVGNTFNNALKVMADYFIRDITDQVIIVSEKPQNGKSVPNGVCVDSNNQSAVTVFKSQNRKLHQTKEIKSCADFTACLWCPYYRCVADALHVWKLLSYRDYVIADMKSSAATFDTRTQQLEQIEHLKQRVEDVLTNISKLNNSAIIEGHKLLNDFGIHKDWEMVTP